VLNSCFIRSHSGMRRRWKHLCRGRQVAKALTRREFIGMESLHACSQHGARNTKAPRRKRARRIHGILNESVGGRKRRIEFCSIALSIDRIHNTRNSRHAILHCSASFCIELRCIHTRRAPPEKNCTTPLTLALLENNTQSPCRKGILIATSQSSVRRDTCTK
jgi:hypothetical protein